MQAWLAETYDGSFEIPISDEQQFRNLLLQFITESDKGINALKKQQLGFITSKDEEGNQQLDLKYMAVTAQTIGKKRAANNEKLPVNEMWTERLADFMEKEAPQGINNVFATATIFWAFMATETAFFQNALTGMAIAIAFSFLIVLGTTQNLIITIYAIICVIFICAIVVSMMVL